jgi:hypothetical protein
MKERQQNSTSNPIMFLMIDSADHITGKPGLTPTVTISKNGGAFGAVTGAVTALSGGWYSIAGNATDRNTLGELLIHATAAGADPYDDKYDIVPWNPYGVNFGMVFDTTQTVEDNSVAARNTYTTTTH